jgi:hypothetical protein
MLNVGEKQDLERSAIAEFAAAFTVAANRGVLAFETLLKPPHPDARCSVNGSAVFVEIAHLYGTDSDARELLGRTGHASPTDEERRLHRSVPLHARILGPLNRILAQKATKSYPDAPIWLVIRNGFPIWKHEEFTLYRGDIVVPKIHPFSEIWLLCGITRESRLVRLA